MLVKTFFFSMKDVQDLTLKLRAKLLLLSCFSNLVPRSHSVTGNVRSDKVRQYTIFHWPLKKGCGNVIYAPIGLFRGARNEGLVFASSCAVVRRKVLFFPTPEKLYSKGKSF